MILVKVMLLLLQTRMRIEYMAHIIMLVIQKILFTPLVWSFSIKTRNLPSRFQAMGRLQIRHMWYCLLHQVKSYMTIVLNQSP